MQERAVIFEPNDELTKTWRESAFCRLTSVSVHDGFNLRFEFTRVDQKVVDMDFVYIDDEGGPGFSGNASKVDRKFYLDSDAIEKRILAIICLNGEPDESSKALRARDFHNNHERLPNCLSQDRG